MCKPMKTFDRLVINQLSVVGTCCVVVIKREDFIKCKESQKVRHVRVKKSVLYAINIILPLALGLIVYVFDKPKSFISNWVFNLTGFRSNTYIFPKIIDYHFPDFVWAYSLMFVLYIVSGIYKKKLVLSILISVVFSIALEVIQLFQTNMFTFDVIDIGVEILAILMAALIIKIIERKV